MGDIIYLNGQLLSIGESRITPIDQGFLYGAGLFETMRSYSGKIFLLERHVERLLSSAQALGIGDLDKDGLTDACHKVLSANRLKDASIRLTVSRGDSRFLYLPGDKPTILAQARTYNPPSEGKYQEGYRATISRIKRYSKSILVRHKTTSYFECVLAQTEAREDGYDEAIFLNEQDNLTEGSVTNLFLIESGGSIVTPSLEEGLLPGITRQCVLELAMTNGYKVMERGVNRDSLSVFSEAFLTNSLIGIMPLATLDSKKGRPSGIARGNISDDLSEIYSQAVRRSIG